MKILFIGEHSTWSRSALSYLSLQSANVDNLIWSKGMPNSNFLDNWQGDWILSFKSDLVLSIGEIKQAKYGAINFHPAPPWYRGVGGYWHAIQKQDNIFGCTSHYMDEKIDHGQIIEVRSLQIRNGENLRELYCRTANLCLEQFKHTTNLIFSGITSFPRTKYKWKGRLYNSSELPEDYFETVKHCNQKVFPFLEKKVTVKI